MSENVTSGGVDASLDRLPLKPWSVKFLSDEVENAIVPTGP